MTRQTNMSEYLLKKRAEYLDKARCEYIKELEKKLAHYEDNCTIVWMPEDVLCRDDTLTDGQVSWVLERMEHKHDASLGISWDTVDFWIDEVKSDDR